MRFHKPKTSFLFICKPLPLNATKIKNNSSGLKVNPIPDNVFQTFDKQGGFLSLVRKTALKAVRFTQITCKLVHHIFGL